ncbi:MAG: MotA/TolQ/ExbB proton channel family protein [Gemmatimonadales bacterium]
MLFAIQVSDVAPTSVRELLAIATPITLVVLVVIAILSVYSWFVMGVKWWQFRKIRRQADRFFTAIEGSPKLPDAYRVVMKLPPSPFNRLFREAMNFYGELVPGFTREGPTEKVGLTPTQLEAFKMTLTKEVGVERDAATRNVSSLATVGTVSPLLGLLGTVLGVMHTFVGLGSKGSGNIAAVAPGIADALIATAGGIGAAIPALMAYNYFANKISQFESELEGFANGLVGWMAREGWL